MADASHDDSEAAAEILAAYESGRRDFSSLQLFGVRLAGVDLTGCDFTSARFFDCIFAESTFDDAVLDGAEFERCNCIRGKFQRASMKRVRLNPSAFARADFNEADLSGADFLNCNASGAYFGLANLADASLYGGSFAGAMFTMTNLTGATLVGADFKDAEVRYFNFISSDTIAKNARLLSQSLGQRAQLEKALSRATPGMMKLAARIAREHAGGDIEPMQPDEIRATIERLDRMHDHLRRFLLSSGCDPEEVVAMDVAAGEVRPGYPRVFISYSSEDEEIAERIYSILTEFGVDAWFAPESMRGGRRINEQLEDAIADRDKIILILSESSMGSNWVKSELQWAAEREIDEEQQILFPIRVVPFDAIREWKLFDADVGQDVAKYVRQYFIPDFSSWQDPAALARLTERLLSDLRESSRL